MLYNELPISFPWYDKIEQQDRYNENVEPVCDYKLITPANALLPFQFTRSISSPAPIVWEIYEVNSNLLIANISSGITLLDQRPLNGKKYFTYFGQQMPGMALAPGYYYSRMVFPDGSFQFSEMFHVPDDAFNIADDDNIRYLKLTWYNDNDLNPVFYNNKDSNGVPKFKNVAYIDSFVTASEPEIVEDGTRDGIDELIATFQKVAIPYRITFITPDFLKKAFALLPLHDHVILTTKKGVRTGTLEKAKVTSTLEASGALSIVDIVWQEIVIVKKGCGENMQ